MPAHGEAPGHANAGQGTMARVWLIALGAEIVFALPTGANWAILLVQWRGWPGQAGHDELVTAGASVRQVLAGIRIQGAVSASRFIGSVRPTFCLMCLGGVRVGPAQRQNKI
jgi:hypothetical protein